MNKMMVLKHCVCWTCDYSMKLVNMATGETLIEGDCYHDKIEKKIEGFIEGLRYAGIVVVMFDNGDLQEYHCENCSLEEKIFKIDDTTPLDF